MVGETSSPGDRRRLIYDWNAVDRHPRPPQRVLIADDTLREGPNSPSVMQPDIQDKVYLLYLMNSLGVDCADLGLASAGPRFKDQVTVLAREIANQKMAIQPQSAARSTIADVAAVADASDKAGIGIEACIFLGASPIRRYVEGWDGFLRQTEDSVRFAVEHDLPVMFITEDTTRADPETLRTVYQTAIRAGATRICAADTVGHAVPDGVFSLIAFLRKVADEVDPTVNLDWHGHRDRGMEIANAMAAIDAGVDRIHACGLGLGERSGTTPMEVLLVNLNLFGWSQRDLRRLPEYCRVIAEKFGAPIAFNYPVVGADAFRTSTGVHAAAIVKAQEKGDAWLADAVYCGIPASMVGRQHTIEIGPMSGEHNVRYILRKLKIEENPAFIQKILEAAKRASKLLTEQDVRRMVRVMQARLKAGRSLEEPDVDAPAGL
jgi:2-isopropylmalate synthase